MVLAVPASSPCGLGRLVTKARTGRREVALELSRETRGIRAEQRRDVARHGGLWASGGGAMMPVATGAKAVE